MKPLNFEPYVDKVGESKEEKEFEVTEGPGDRKVRQARRDLRIAKKNRRQSRRWGWRRWGWRRGRRGPWGPSTTCDLCSFLCCCLATADAVTN
jgi:hypothetical protein